MRIHQLWRSWLAKTRFQAQLIVLSGIGLLILATTITLASSEFLNRRLEQLALNLLEELTERLAGQSRLIFLGSPQVASGYVVETARLPGVLAVEFLKPSGESWVASGNTDCKLPRFSKEIEIAYPQLIKENQYCWLFVAPVQLQIDNNPLTELREPQLLGYLVIAWRKEVLLQLQSGFLLINGVVTLIVVFGIGLGFQVVLRRLIAPLNHLSLVIRQLHAGAVGTRTPVAGPADIRDMGRMFNALLDDVERHRAALEQQQKELESLVTMRTQDLRAARDAALTAMRYKSEFMAAITHEMRMPLQSIIGYTREGQKSLVFLEEDADPVVLEQLARNLGIVRQASDDLLLRINQVLDLAALEAGKQDLQLEIVDLPLLLAEITDLLKPLITRNHNRVESIFKGQRRVLLDEDKIRQIIRNLLDNACKFTQSGLVLLEVICTQDVLVIEVADCGIGISDEVGDLIFEPFRQADMSDSRYYGGTGLGLAITRSLCKLLGGTIGVSSILGTGSLFQVVIPLPINVQNN